MKASAARRDITPPVGMDITHPDRPSIGVHDPLFLQVLIMEDAGGTRLAIVRFDLIHADFEVADALRETIGKELGTEHVLLNFAHPHSSQELGMRSKEDTVYAKWTNRVHDEIMGALTEARDSLEPVSLHTGRAPAQVGYNRRQRLDSGYVWMAPNREGPVVPWVNVLVVERREEKSKTRSEKSDKESSKNRSVGPSILDPQPTGSPNRTLCVLFEHPAHPVIVPDTSGLISADFPGAAVARIHEVIGDEAVAMFGQGCAGNINGYPLRTTHENAEKAGRNLGDAVLKAMKDCVPIESDRFVIREAKHIALPSRDLPSMAEWQETADSLAAYQEKGPTKWHDKAAFRSMNERMEILKGKIERNEKKGAPRRLDVMTVMLGREWILVALPHEMFCQYELWVDANAPFEHNMTFGYTNGVQGYIAVDEDLALGAKGGYEAGSLPSWQANNALSDYWGPPAVGVEAIIKDTIAGLWE